MNTLHSYRLSTRKIMSKKITRPRQSGTPPQNFEGNGYDDVATRIPQIPNPRRAQEINDGRILHNDHSAMSNLPSRPIHREFNKYEPTMFEEGED